MGLGEVVLVREEAEHALMHGVVTHCPARRSEIGFVRQRIDRVSLDEHAPVRSDVGRGLDRRRLAIGRFLGEVCRLSVQVGTLEDFERHRSTRETGRLE